MRYRRRQSRLSAAAGSRVGSRSDSRVAWRWSPTSSGAWTSSS